MMDVLCLTDNREVSSFELPVPRELKKQEGLRCDCLRCSYAYLTYTLMEKSTEDHVHRNHRDSGC